MFFTIIRRVDELGRLVLPIDLRKHFGITPGDPVLLSDTEKGILISKHRGDEESCRTLDELGRIVIPCNMRRKYRLSPKSELVITPTEKGILLSPPQQSILNETCVEKGNELILSDPAIYAFLAAGADLAGVSPKEYLLRLEEVLEQNPDALFDLMKQNCIRK